MEDKIKEYEESLRETEKSILETQTELSQLIELKLRHLGAIDALRDAINSDGNDDTGSD